MSDIDKEMRECLEKIAEFPADHLECSAEGECVEWALQTIDRLQAEITELKAKNGELYSKWLHEGRY